MREQERFIGLLPAKHKISFLEGNYEKERFYETVKGLEKIPEGGERCFACYRLRLSEAIKEAEKADNGTEITPYHSSVDKDGDGTDDQTDILKNALVYVKKRPVYKSRYYQTGYPDDRYGVCTDVVGYALKKSGYDLRELVDEDIRKNPKDYDIDEPDKNIDFRRVKNLRIYFEHTATSLTMDVNDIEQWQGGDIVVFKNHIGVISDRRNVEGVPYVIHHNDPYQKNYEEDILQERTDIVGHFRIS